MIAEGRHPSTVPASAPAASSSAAVARITFITIDQLDQAVVR
jgi:hypothetical protein